MVNVNDKFSHAGLTAAHLTLKGLHQQAHQFKTKLLQLRQSLDLLQAELNTTHQCDLVADNAQLLLTTIQAEQALEKVKTPIGELTPISQRDASTDTTNRPLMLDRISRSINYARRHRRHLALIVLDLEHFKQINDNSGHQAGDNLLKLVTRHLNSVLRQSDTISRHGGDKFLILLSAIESDQAVSAIATKILHALATPVILMEQPMLIKASLGIAFFPAHGTDAQRLIRSADDAMYQSKRRGGNCYSIWNATTSTLQRHQATNFIASNNLVSSLRVRALTHRQPGRQPPY